LVSNIIGTGIRPQSQHPDPAMRVLIEALWERWEQECDATGSMDFYGLQALACRQMVEAGEAFLRLVTPEPNGAALPFRLQLLDPSQIDGSLNRDPGAGLRIRSGIEIDAEGKRRAYYVLPYAPGELVTYTEAVRLPAEDIIHLFEPLAPGQLRGLPWLTPALLRLNDLQQYEDAQLMRQKVSALFTGFIYSPDGAAAGFTGEQTGSALEAGLEPGTLKLLPAGYDLKFSDPAEVGAEYDAFVRVQLRAVAAAIGTTYEQLSGDMTGVNYSSARVALIDFRRRVQAIQQQIVVHQLCRPVWRRFIETAVLQGALQGDLDELLSARWIPPGFQHVDPLKDAQAEILMINSGLKSRSEAVGERGRDVEELDQELAADQARAAGLGLAFSSSTSRPSGADNDDE
jgi:lambda family phage portal protein